ncbi:MAG: cytochrome c-type biogenesis protein CcmH [Alphaproteobacteria bacterium]
MMRHTLIAFRAFISVLAVALLLGVWTSGARAVEPDEMLKDPAKEAEARVISAELRCLVCQGQSIDDSNAPLARDLRLLVRERLKAGDNRQQVIDFMVARYGDFILLRPRFTTLTMLLWIAPIILLIIGGTAFYFVVGSRKRGAQDLAPPPLSEDEKSRLADIMNGSADASASPEGSGGGGK